ncbi:hypothetical protein BU24DRAFT_215771 [Aaosphaeria arxii CBS 175.79]|uniref:Uncharacterized protein n=1 Tax=Aaosphaeria arxii CBS 175.79 TaxID=1450172 RepID=A0A6A5XNL3_9PLEO|nr:uncharacterized protein BU24DRAFT_215771 [Aaosphaeria arxii CBS 175.79]KAF2014496.1 hypothetical protein BU24DRAFT_215771 [Aaosphaeria arxii CBS 175.79]
MLTRIRIGPGYNARVSLNNTPLAFSCIAASLYRPDTHENPVATFPARRLSLVSWLLLLRVCSCLKHCILRHSGRVCCFLTTSQRVQRSARNQPVIRLDSCLCLVGEYRPNLTCFSPVQSCRTWALCWRPAGPAYLLTRAGISLPAYCWLVPRSRRTA